MVTAKQARVAFLEHEKNVTQSDRLDLIFQRIKSKARRQRWCVIERDCSNTLNPEIIYHLGCRPEDLSGESKFIYETLRDRGFDLSLVSKYDHHSETYSVIMIARW